MAPGPAANSREVEHAPSDGAEADLRALTEAFDRFNRTSATMEESYRKLEARIQSLDSELQEKNRQLTLTTEYLNAVLNSMSDGVIAVSRGGAITTWNPAAANILGLDEDITGRPYAEVFGERAAGPGARLKEWRNRKGQKVPVSERTAPINDRNGERLGEVSVFQDLSELEALRGEVRRKDRLAALGEMAATVAHEIRNPLGGIQGFAALLERDLPADDPRHRLVEKILAGTRSLDRVVNELLEYTRPVELRIEPIDARKLVDSAIGYLSGVPGGIETRNSVALGLVLRGDAHRLRQVILNVLQNAVQSIDGAGRVEVTARAGADTITISIADTGCGIAAEHVEKVFMPFFTTREKGTGLGLAAASKLVEAHGGLMDVSSTPGEGATFRITLPRGEQG